MATTTPTPRRAVHLAAGAALAGLLGAGLAACGDDGTTTTADTAASAPQTTATIPAPGSTAAAAVPSAAGLTPAEAAGLTYMVEEEKLARDVYVTLGQSWDLPVFDTIAAAETAHTDAVRALLDRYGLPDPTAGADVGQFTDPTLAALYTELTSRGSTSLVEALRVGALIEETDIVDLRTRTDETDQAAIVTVYDNLRAGSENHLRAFVGALEARGETYTPVRLDQATYDAIIATSTGRGPGS